MHFTDAKTLLSAQNGMNLYRGCTHGCIYCDARSACYRMEHAFEDVEVKRNAPALLEAALRKKRARCMIGTGAMCDPYLPEERTLGLTRRCLALLQSYGFGLAIQTKSDLILRDLDLLDAIHAQAKCVVQMTLTTADEVLCRIVEPNVCTTARRFEVLRTLQAHGIPTVVWIEPLLPFLNDTPENLAALLDMCAEAGVWGIICFGMGLTLREGSREHYYQALDRHFPGLKARYQQTYGYAYMLPSPNAPALWEQFAATCDRYGIVHGNERVFAFLRAFRQPTLF
ncbi:MAG: SPL family radical SAM protein [Candidatus Aphodomorpha sp.]